MGEARKRIRDDAVAAGLPDDNHSLDAGGTGAEAYADAVSTYLGFCVDKNSITNTTLATWQKDPDRLTQAFSRQAIPMTWDFAEANPLSEAGGGFIITQEAVIKVLDRLPINAAAGSVQQGDAKRVVIGSRMVSTDPPYYDNINYADLSDYFYVWLRRTLRSVFPNLFATISVPKAEELVAAPHRHGSSEKAEEFFLRGMTQAMQNLSQQAHSAIPITIYYAFKQSDTESAEGIASTGWVTFLEAVLSSGLALTGTWPMRTELVGSLKKTINALASSVVLVCRPRAKDAGTISRKQFMRMLNEALPPALEAMTRKDEGDHSPVAPVDLSQAIIGPGMAIFSRYDAVLEADGKPMSVKTALQLINRFLAEDDFDADTQFCLHWFEQYGWDSGKFGEADTLARAKGTSVDGVQVAGVIESGGGKVRLLKWKELELDWDPETDPRIPIWQVLHQLILAYQKRGDSGAAAVYAHPKVIGKTEAARQLAYRLYTLCERRGWAEDARGYNELVTGWSGIESAAAKLSGSKQGGLFDEE